MPRVSTRSIAGKSTWNCYSGSTAVKSNRQRFIQRRRRIPMQKDVATLQIPSRARGLPRSSNNDDPPEWFRRCTARIDRVELMMQTLQNVSSIAPQLEVPRDTAPQETEAVQNIPKLEAGAHLFASSSSSSTVNQVTDLSLRHLIPNPLQRSFSWLERPKFEGRDMENPVDFVEAVERYGRVCQLSDVAQLALALEGLRGDAKRWTAIYKYGDNSWTCFQEFRRDFLACFWSHTKQMEVSRFIVEGQYKPGRGNTMFGHFSRCVNLANCLIPPIEETTLLELVMNHFPGRLLTLWRQTDARTMQDTVQFFLVRGPRERNVGRRSRPRQRDMGVQQGSYRRDRRNSASYRRINRINQANRELSD